MYGVERGLRLELAEESEDSEESYESDDDKFFLWSDSACMHQRPYEKLIVWQEAHALCLWIYKRTQTFPENERFGVISQMRRASSSIPTNIAEGNGRHTIKDKSHFFVIAHASLEELHYHLRLAKDLEYLSDQEFLEVTDRIHRTSYLLTKLRKNLSTYRSSDSSES